jgi:hypothetical protein
MQAIFASAAFAGHPLITLRTRTFAEDIDHGGMLCFALPGAIVEDA